MGHGYFDDTNGEYAIERLASSFSRGTIEVDEISLRSLRTLVLSQNTMLSALSCYRAIAGHA